MSMLIVPGMAVEIRNAYGEIHRAVAASGVEPTHRDGRKIHDFPVVWVDINGQRLPWPAEDVQAVT